MHLLDFCIGLSSDAIGRSSRLSPVLDRTLDIASADGGLGLAGVFLRVSCAVEDSTIF